HGHTDGRGPAASRVLRGGAVPARTRVGRARRRVAPPRRAPRAAGLRGRGALGRRGPRPAGRGTPPDAAPAVGPRGADAGSTPGAARPGGPGNGPGAGRCWGAGGAPTRVPRPPLRDPSAA